MKKTLSLLLAFLMVFGVWSVIPALQASAEDTVTLRTYTNIARGKQVKTGNDTAFQSGSYVTDGSYGGTGVDISWGSLASPAANCYVIVDLAQTYTVNGVKVANYADTGRYYCWDAYASIDQSAWTLIAQKTSAAPSISGGYYFETDEIEARYIKVVGTYHSANSGYHFVEVEVFSPDEYTDGETVNAVYAGEGYTGTLSADGTLAVTAGSGDSAGEQNGEEPAAQFAGSGTAEDPYLITSADDFKALTDLMNDSDVEATAYGTGCFFKQTADIDMTGYADYEGTHAGDSSFKKVYFGGIYDGCGHTLTVGIDTTGQTSIFPYITGAIINMKFAGSINSDSSTQPIRTIQAGAVLANVVFNMTITTTGVGCGVCYSQYGTLLNVYVTGTARSKAVYNTTSGSYYHVFTNVVKSTDGSSLTHSTCTASNDLDEIAAAFNNREDEAYTSGAAALTLVNADLTGDALGTVTVENGELVLSDGVIGSAPVQIAGSGTVDDPYIIATAADFKALTDLCNSSTSSSDPYGAGCFFKQTADIDMTDYPGYDGTHVLNDTRKVYFGGIYDGAGHILTVNIVSEGQTSVFPYITGAIINLTITGSIDSGMDTSTASAQPIRAVQSGAVVANCMFDMALSATIANGVTYSSYGTLFNVYATGIVCGSKASNSKAIYRTNSGGSYYHVFNNVTDSTGEPLTHSTTTAESNPNVIAEAFNNRTDEDYSAGVAALAAVNADLTCDALGIASVESGMLVLSAGVIGGSPVPDDPIVPTGAVGDASSAATDYPWNAVRSAIRKVVIDDSITEIGANAFANCPNLHTAVVMGKVTYDANAFGTTLTKLITFGEYYTDVYVKVRGTANENALRWALSGAYGGPQWTTLEDDSILYVYGCGALNYQNRDSIPWFLASSIRGKYEKVIVADAISDIGMYAFSADAYGKLTEIVLGASVQQFKYQSMAYIKLAALTFLAPITYFGHYTTTGNKYSETLEVTIASGQSSEDLISKQDGYPSSGTAGNEKLHNANFTNVDLRHIEWVDDTTGKVVYATYIADGQTPVFPVENTYVYEGVTYRFDVPELNAVTEDTVVHLSSIPLIDYDITWVRADNTSVVLYTEKCAYGTTPVYGGVTRIEENGSVYVATLPEVAPVTGEATYEVTFTALPRYTIRWINGDTGDTIYEAQVSETLYPEFGGTLPAAYTVGDVTYTPVLPPVHEVTGAEDYTVYFYADYDTANYPDIYPNGINYKLLDDTTLYIYGTGAIPSYESSGGDDAPWAQYRSTITKIIVSDGITEIGSCALRNYPNLTEIVLGKDVRHFMYAAFAIDYNLEYMTFLGEITYYFGHHCFSGISKALKVTQAAGQTHADLIYQQYGHGNAAGNDQLFNVTAANYTMVPRIVARFVDGKTGDTLFITSLASGTVPYFAGTMPESYTENGIVYTPVMPQLTAITESTTYTITYTPDHEHQWGDWTVTPATFTAGGSKTHTCEHCGFSETVDIDAVTLGVYENAIIGEKDGKNTASFVGTISSTDLDLTSVDYIAASISYVKDNQTVTVEKKVRSVYTTVLGVASTAADTAAAGELEYIDAGYIFALRMVGVPEGVHTLTVKFDAIYAGVAVATAEKEITFTV